ncbi:MAG: STAS domain-containing protein [SAR324 cluster bacterium]|nr:STAS domain-containing protein [SAR324 cluster bacterium]
MDDMSHYEQNRIYIVSMSDDILSDTVSQVNRYLKPLMDAIENSKIEGLLLDCHRVGMIDSAGIGMLCGKYVRLKKFNKKFALCQLDQDLFIMLEKLDLIKKLRVVSNVNTALHSIGYQAIDTFESLRKQGEQSEKTIFFGKS